MNCYFHPNEPAVATCKECGKGLCRACAGKYDPPLCDACFEKLIQRHENKVRRQKEEAIEELREDRQSDVKYLLISAITFVVGLVAGWVASGQLYTGIGIGLLTVVIPAGWSALNRITPDVFLILPVVGWAIFFFVKLILSVAVGTYWAPVKIIRTIIRVFKNKKQEQEIDGV